MCVLGFDKSMEISVLYIPFALITSWALMSGVSVALKPLEIPWKRICLFSVLVYIGGGDTFQMGDEVEFWPKYLELLLISIGSSFIFLCVYFLVQRYKRNVRTRS